jgi:hypothetical protein
MLDDKIEQHPDQLIDQETLLGDAMRGAAATLEARLDFRPAALQRIAQQRQDGIAIRGRDILGEHAQRLAQRAPVDDLPLLGDRG